MILVDYIETEKYGKLAHFLNEKGIDVFSQVIEDGDSVFYTELSEDIQQELRNELVNNAD